MPADQDSHLDELLERLNALAGQLPDSTLAFYEPQPAHEQFFNDLCQAYLAAAEAGRASIRSAAGRHLGLLNHLLGYVYKAAHQMHSQSDRPWLRTGLAAASIENCSFDFRDFLLALTELFLAAEASGLDPRRDFEEVAALSSKEPPRGGSTPVAQMLAGFHNSVVLDSERKRRRKNAGHQL